MGSDMLKPAEILKRPYGRTVTPEPDGSFFAEIVEFQGCIATGETAAAALTTLEEVAEAWLENALANGQSIPEPIETSDYSGKFVFRMPKSMHRQVAYAAKRDGVSQNQFALAAVATYLGERKRETSFYGGSITVIDVSTGPVYIGGGGIETVSGQWRSIGSNVTGREMVLKGPR